MRTTDQYSVVSEPCVVVFLGAVDHSSNCKLMVFIRSTHMPHHENRTRDTLLRGIYIPKCSEIEVKVSVLVVSAPPLHAKFPATIGVTQQLVR